MIFKRILASLCVVAFCVSLMVGCTKPPADNGDSGDKGPGTTAAAEE